MKSSVLAILCLLAIDNGYGQSLLIFTKTNGYRHQSIDTGIATLVSIANELGVTITHSEDSLYVSPAQLDTVDLLIFLNTSGDVLGEQQQRAVENFIRSGKAFMGIHGAAATEYNWSWYGALVGRYFVDHPAVQKASVQIDKNHPITRYLPEAWSLQDEWYNFEKPFPSSLQVLLTVDESSYSGGTMGVYHPITWCQNFDGGKSFYTGLGHNAATYHNETFRSLLKAAISWSLTP